MSGLRSRNKGARIEREVVNLFQEAGIAAERVPLSGAAGGSYKGDVSMPVLGRDVTLEVKARASGFKSIYGWLSENYGLVLRADRQAPLIVLRLSDFAELARLSDEFRIQFEPKGEAA